MPLLSFFVMFFAPMAVATSIRVQPKALSSKNSHLNFETIMRAYNICIHPPPKHKSSCQPQRIPYSTCGIRPITICTKLTTSSFCFWSEFSFFGLVIVRAYSASRLQMAIHRVHLALRICAGLRGFLRRAWVCLTAWFFF